MPAAFRLGGADPAEFPSLNSCNAGEKCSTLLQLSPDVQMDPRICRPRAELRVGHTQEPLDLVGTLPNSLMGYDTCLLDCLTLWVSNLLLSKEGNPEAQDEILASARELLDVYEQSQDTWIVVSNEVGLGVVPPSRLGSVYRDALGKVNQVVAARADKVYLMVAGLALDLKAMGAVPYPDLNLRLT